MSTPVVSSDVMIRPMNTEDVAQVVQVHLASFPGFFLSFLGRDFLKLLYENIQCDPYGIVLVAPLNGHIEGFVAGVTDQSGFYQRLVKKRKWAFARAAGQALVRNPTIASRLLRALNRPNETRAAEVDACLMSVAVRPEAEGKGIGRRLVTAFCEELAERGIGSVCLDTDRDGNERANRFYQKLGFQLVRSFVTPEGRAMNAYVAETDLAAVRRSA